jgi:U4/U6 small nuclear ribonucleoprotein PRP4
MNTPQQHPSSGSVQVLNLSAASEAQRLQHQTVLLDLEAKKIAGSLVVPTLPDQVRAALRELQCPVRLFGENLANVRDRLRLELARRQLLSQGISGDGSLKQENSHERMRDAHDDEEEVTKYTRASAALVQARQDICLFSLRRAAIRLGRERTLRAAAAVSKRKRDVDSDDKISSAALELERLDRECSKLYQRLGSITLESSQYGDNRTMSCIAAQTIGQSNTPLIATGSWTGSIHLWDGSSSSLQKIGERNLCHEDRIMGLSMMTVSSTIGSSHADMTMVGADGDDGAATAILCTASIDMTAKLWKVVPTDPSEDGSGHQWSLLELAHLKGHKARLCRTAFHPMKKHVATTSFDHSWRLWDVETNQEMLLLQDGHWKEVYGVGFHPDGSLCATTDFCGVVQVWDLRTGKSIRHFMGHAQRVLNAEFHPTNGFQMATSGDDGTIKIWDLRKRKMTASIPAHSNLVTQLRFDPAGGEFLASSSFDGTIKLWNTRNWKMLNVLHGHEGKVAGLDISAQGIVSCGFDKTLKLWT